MKRFVVTYYVGGSSSDLGCKVVTGNQLAEMYGFSDCTGDEIIRVWELYSDGNLIPCEFWGSTYSPMNVLMVHRAGNYEPYEYEWPEH